ncbi:MAG: exodeoxyribonuclease VII large subunit, partial [Thermodesulfobacteriota bacterium]|nr:exodeoxyribonuclease VII large subunit [Thermodesulfobacteriota bacterium]
MSEDLFGREVFSVAELTGRVKDLIETEFGMVRLWGEVSNLRRPSSGHYYLTLKDRDAQIRAVMFRTQQRYLDFDPADGLEVLVRGRLSVYEPRGEYQIIIEYMEPRGEGALGLAFEKLKAQLESEGLFDEERKKILPFMPQRVALVTSPTGAAVRDFIRVARRRFENTILSIYPVRVQGEGAGAEIAQAVADLNRWGGFDLIVLTRGGGSLEDLWAFNEEVTARAVAASEIPVVSAVGHEVDFTITDFVADLRAPTPSAAAELIFREKEELRAYVAGAAQRMASKVRGVLSLTEERLAHLDTRLGDPRRALSDRRLLVDDLAGELILETRRALTGRSRELQTVTARLSP